LSHPEASKLSFDLITRLVSDGPEQSVTPDNCTGFITLLDDFATAAGIQIEAQQKYSRRHEPAKAEKQVS
jgi:golgi-specific brefeldin A-resistance guanine nucleotide exchange factor 1